LFETEEFEDRQVDGGVETETAFVWAQNGVVLVDNGLSTRPRISLEDADLDTITTVNLSLAVVILPDNPELDNSFGDLNDFESFSVGWVFLEERPQAGFQLIQRLSSC